MIAISETLAPAFWVARREVRDQFRDWRVIFPILFLTAFFPFLMNFTARQLVGFAESYGAIIVAERLIPFLLMIVGFFPTSMSLVIALETFVGEKERGSIEPLLATPLTDAQLYIGKLLAATVPPLVGSFLGMAVYTLGLARSGMHLPETVQLLQIISLTVIQAVVMVSGAVVVSVQATSVRAANLLASFIIIPMALLIQLESVVMFWANFATLWWLELGLVVLAVLLIRVGLAHFQREELLGRELDTLNFRWGWGIFRSAFTGNSRNLWDWYTSSVWPTVKGMGIPSLLVLVVMGIIFGVGALEEKNFPVPLQQLKDQAGIFVRVDALFRMWPVFSLGPVLGIWMQNVRVLFIGVVGGIFSFGILGLLPPLATMAITGYLMELLAAGGVSPLSYLAGFILPHGIIEIPMVVLATAAVLKMGAALATPDARRTIGETWLASLADWSKIMVGVAIPLLLIAAMLEAWVTPLVATWLIHF